MLAFAEATGGDADVTYVLEAMRARGWRADAAPDYLPPFTGLWFAVLQIEATPAGEAAFVDWAKRRRETAVRDAAGAMLHMRNETRGGGHAMLLDAVHEYTATMAQAGAISGDAAFFDECVRQCELYRAVLRDPATGLWRQGRSWETDPDVLSPHAWSRGQGWLMRGLVESWSHLPIGSTQRRSLTPMFNELADVLAAAQRDDGLWPALIDLPDRSPGESSGTGLIAAAVRRADCIGLPVSAAARAAADRAADRLVQCVDDEGIVHEACPGPGPLTAVDAANYLDIEGFEPDEPHGYGAILFALTEPLRRR